MIPEMLLIKALWENNRSLWYRSFPFHFGLYVLIGWAGLLVVGAPFRMADDDITAARIRQHLRRDIARVGALRLRMAVLSAQRDSFAKLVPDRSQHGGRRVRLRRRARPWLGSLCEAPCSVPES